MMMRTTVAIITLLCLVAMVAVVAYTETHSHQLITKPQSAASGYSSTDLLELERQGRVEATGVQFFTQTPIPTDMTFQSAVQSSSLGDVPAEWDWRIHARLHSNVLTQRVPNWCGACFAFGAISSLTDRFLIQHPKVFPDTILSVQETLNCASTMGYGYVGCSGSQFERVYSYIEKWGVVDQTCNPYIGVERAFTVLGQDCPRKQCRSCISDGSCATTAGGRKWGISSWGRAKGEEQMKYQIYTGGPISCYINTHVPAYVEYKGGIMSDPTVFKDPIDITHVVSLIGYGEENGVPFWSVRNWAGTQWGEDGFFRIFRGNNTMNIESGCGYGNPNPDWTPQL